MGQGNIKTGMIKKLPAVVLMFLLLQPLLDVFSYFYAGTVSLLLRFGLLACIALLGFVISSRKKVYIIFYSVVILFWILHAANCFRIGYTSFVDDTSNYLRIISLPVYTLSFMTFFNQGKGIRRNIYLGIAANFALVILFTVIPWATGNPVYTYERLGVGIMGWFSVKNAQSAIVALLTPITIYFAYKTKKYFVYVLAAVLTFGLLFLTGTKLTFYAIFLIAAGYILLFVLNLKKKSVLYVIPLVVLVAAAVVLRPVSPMQIRENMSDHAKGNYAELVEQSIRSNLEDEALLESIKKGEIDENSPEQIAKVRKSLIGVYTDKEVYGKIFKDINGRFGVYNVMKAYGYTSEPAVLSDSREQKTTFAKLIWEEKDFLTRLFGFEYSDMLYGESIYDLENDFPAVFYFCGFIGFGVYMLFFVYFIFVVIRRVIRSPKTFLTIEMGAVGMMFVLALGAAQISGNVLRRPNVTAYFAMAAACLYHLCVNKLPPLKEKYSKEETVF